MIRNFMQKLMFGRYGNDQLNIFLLILFWVFWLINVLIPNVTASLILDILTWIAFFLAFIRLMSRNYSRRRAENEAFLRIAGPFISGFKRKRNQARDRDHAYFKCPQCSTTLRVPRGRGRISINCRKCGTVFQKKT